MFFKILSALLAEPLDERCKPDLSNKQIVRTVRVVGEGGQQ